jgi:hypothetical protein
MRIITQDKPLLERIEELKQNTLSGDIEGYGHI